MGQAQSSGSQEHQPSDGSAKRCLYEILNVEEHCSSEELKKAYRKKALELHPDRNFGDADEATKLFAEVQAAYEVLSDPNERAWYDSHRETLLHGTPGKSETHYEHNVRVTTAEDITKMYMDFNGRFDYSDGPSGFYSIIGELFERLAREEEIACDWQGIEYLIYPPFGAAGDDYEDVVKQFYGAWSSFATKKSFSWKDVYRYSEASDRRTRRMMEKENKRLREEGIREFNEAVRAVVTYVKRHDPRYVPNFQTQEARQEMLRNLAATQAAKSRAANQAKLVDVFVPDWSIPKDSEEDKYVDSQESEDELKEHFECVVCKKVFKSENQYSAHENSKKHTKAVFVLRRQMHKDNLMMEKGPEETKTPPTPSPGDVHGPGCDMPTSDAGTMANLEAKPLDAEDVALLSGVGHMRTNDSHIAMSPEVGFEDAASNAAASSADSNSQASTGLGEEGGQVNGKTRAPGVASGKKEATEEEEDMEEDFPGQDEYAPRTFVVSRAHSSQESMDNEALEPPADANPPHHASKGTPIVGKAKIRKAKKAAAQKVLNSNDNSQNSRCAACQQTFTSRNKLFDHIKNERHGQPTPKSKSKS